MRILFMCIWSLCSTVFVTRGYEYMSTRIGWMKYEKLNYDILVTQKFMASNRDIVWPRGIYSMKLGSTTKDIRMGDSHTNKREDLESIKSDFNLQKATYGYESTRAALLNYKKLNRHMLVPKSFVVPDRDVKWPEQTWGMKLGIAVRDIRGGVTYNDKREDFESIGFDFNLQRVGYGYESTRAALLNYKKLNGHMLVPAKFVVPDGDVEWPKCTWDMKLGNTVNGIRSSHGYEDKREDLESIGFDFNLQKNHNEYESTRAALLNYKKLNSHMLVPYKFKVPDRDVEWPEQTWGMKLGSAVTRIRTSRIHTNKREDLESIGFDFNLQKIVNGYDSTRAALLTYKKLNGHMLVPAKFIVPDGNIEWPEQTWGMKLGKAVNNIRSGLSHTNKRGDLESIGFDVSLQSVIYGYESTRAALLNYKKLNGDILVPQKFVVPDGDVAWPEQTWGMKLGTTVNRIRSGRSHKDEREDLENIGFEINLESAKYGVIRVALVNYKKLNDDLLVPQKFKVFDGDIRWPEQTWGMRLGTIVTSIRSGVIHKDKREDLESIGFDFNLQSTKYEIIRALLLNYKKLNGHMLVPQKYLVPDGNIEWPEQTWGMNLGTAVRNIKSGLSYKNERKDLESIGFEFNLQSAKYEIIRALLLNYKKLNGHMLVPAKFTVPERDIAWPEQTWGMHLGCTVTSIRSGLIYKNKRGDLESIGFEFNLESAKYEIIRELLLNYKKLNGHMLVPTKFVVTDSDIAWPEQTWGIRLGTAVTRIRRGLIHKDKREDLDSIGFDFNLQKATYGYESTRVALLNYKKLNSHMLVSYKFVVPESDIAWPESTWGMKLGVYVGNIRRGCSHKSKRIDLESIGFDFNPQTIIK